MCFFSAHAEILCLCLCGSARAAAPSSEKWCMQAYTIENHSLRCCSHTSPRIHHLRVGSMHRDVAPFLMDVGQGPRWKATIFYYTLAALICYGHFLKQLWSFLKGGSPSQSG
eukprot:82242-Pelagomonas_calceolata.AAC.3